MRLHRSVAFGLLLAIALPAWSAETPIAVAGAAGAGNPLSPPAAQIFSFYDHQGVSDVAGQLQEFLERNDALPGSVNPEDLDTEDAVENLEAMLEGDATEEFLEAADDRPELGSPTTLGATAMAYLVRGRSAEALALLFLAHRKAPDDAAAMMNLAAAALAFGKANEALALLDAVEQAGSVPAGGMGLAGINVLAYLRGYAFMLRGEYPKARPLLSRVVEAEPNLKEAALTLALVEARMNADPRKSYLLGVWRQRGKLIVQDRDDPTSEEDARREPDPFTEGNDIFPSMDGLLDVSRGQPGKLMDVQRPATALELIAVSESYGVRMAEAMEAAAQQHNDVAGAALQAFQNAQLPAAYKRRMSDLYDKATIRYGALASLDLAARETGYLAEQLDTVTQAVTDEAMTAREPIMARWAEIANQPGHPTEAELRQMNRELNSTTDQALARVAPLLQRYHAAVDREFTLRSAYMNGMLAHIGDPNLRIALAAEAESVRHEMDMAKLAAVVNLLPTIGAFEEATQATLAAGEGGEGPECDDNEGKDSLSLDVVVADVEINCTSVTLELQAGVVPLIGVSAELGVDISGTVTAFVGPKVDAKVWAQKDGIYITADKDGIRDAGIKAEMKASTGIGPVKRNWKVEETAITFLPAPDPGPPPGPLPVFKG
jgi:tetratricopeptide (TPR) repeat protein